MVKKYFGILTAFTALVFVTSCSNDEVFDATQDIHTAKYEAAFKKKFGEPAPTQTWGFGTSSTRSILKQDMIDQGYPIAQQPAAITNKERAFVNNWFATHPGLSEVGLDIHNFFLQHVIGNVGNKKGIWTHMDPVNDPDHLNDWSEEFTTGEGIMDYLVVGAEADYTVMDHMNDFNAQSGGPFSCIYVKDGSALQFGYHETYDNSYRYLFKLAEITVPDTCFEDGVARTGYYVGLSMYGEKYDNGPKKLGIQNYDIADDWILKIVPGEGEIYTPAIRIMAEDLSATEGSDFDFNDVVFDVMWTSTGARIRLVAAGGTLPLTIEGNEVHQKFAEANPDKNINTDFSKGKLTMINTANGTHKKYKAAVFDVTGNFKDADGNNNANLIKVMVNKGTAENPEWLEITAKEGHVAAKFGIDPKIDWCDERQDIETMWSNFAKWVRGEVGIFY